MSKRKEPCDQANNLSTTDYSASEHEISSNIYSSAIREEALSLWCVLGEEMGKKKKKKSTLGNKIFMTIDT